MSSTVQLRYQLDAVERLAGRLRQENRSNPGLIVALTYWRLRRAGGSPRQRISLSPATPTPRNQGRRRNDRARLETRRGAAR